MTDPDHFGALKPQLYTEAERQRRDSSPWTLVQGVLAPVQFIIFLVSLGLVMRTLMTGEGVFAAHLSILAKTLALYTIMITGCIWEKVVFDCYLFAPPFFWEDVVSMGVMALHTAYVVGWWTERLSSTELLWQCPQCHEWNTFVEERLSPAKPSAALSDLE